MLSDLLEIADKILARPFNDPMRRDQLVPIVADMEAHRAVRVGFLAAIDDEAFVLAQCLMHVVARGHTLDVSKRWANAAREMFVLVQALFGRAIEAERVENSPGAEDFRRAYRPEQ